jgi:hypothetical protein
LEALIKVLKPANSRVFIQYIRWDRLWPNALPYPLKRIFGSMPNR